MDKTAARLASIFSATTVGLVALFVLGNVFNFGYFAYFGIQLSLLQMSFQDMITPHPLLICMTVVCYAMSRALAICPLVLRFLKGLTKDLDLPPEADVRKWGPVLVSIPIAWVGSVVGCIFGFSWGSVRC